VLARHHGVLFIVVAPESSIDLEIPDGSQYVKWPLLYYLLIVLDSIPIEHRPAIEACMARGVVRPSESGTPFTAAVLITPEDIDVYNPSFDVTPQDLISAIVTELGVASKGGKPEDGFNLPALLGD
jgi:methylthioribose-1-phosphate isomerase